MNIAQAGMAVWLMVTVATAAGIALGGRRLPFILALDRRQQRIASGGFAIAAALEALTLYLGGFWHG